MARRERRWAGVAALAAALAAVSVGVGGAAAGDNATNPYRLKDAGTLVVGMNLQYPPQMYLDKNGNPCLEAFAPQDLESTLAMPGGHIYHGDLAWPWANPRSMLDTPAQRWGVQTVVPNVVICGAGAQRGGAISGIGGHNAAMAVLDTRDGRL